MHQWLYRPRAGGVSAAIGSRGRSTHGGVEGGDEPFRCNRTEGLLGDGCQFMAAGQSITNCFPAKKAGAPWLCRSVTPGRATQIARTRSSRSPRGTPHTVAGTRHHFDPLWRLPASAWSGHPTGCGRAIYSWTKSQPRRGSGRVGQGSRRDWTRIGQGSDIESVGRPHAPRRVQPRRHLDW
jgi:hypothetical protein